MAHSTAQQPLQVRTGQHDTHLVCQGVKHSLLGCDALRVICHRKLDVRRVLRRLAVPCQRAGRPQQAPPAKEAGHGLQGCDTGSVGEAAPAEQGRK